MKRYAAVLGVFLGFMTGVTSPALAHKVIVFAYVESGIIFVEGGFGSKRPARACRVTATDHTGAIRFQGQTDDKGMTHFDLPPGPLASLTVVLEAGPGHRGSWTLQKEELMPEIPEQGTEQDSAQASPPDGKKAQALVQGPSPLKIVTGILVIFALALLVRQVSRRKGRS